MPPSRRLVARISQRPEFAWSIGQVMEAGGLIPSSFFRRHHPYARPPAELYEDEDDGDMFTVGRTPQHTLRHHALADLTVTVLCPHSCPTDDGHTRGADRVLGETCMMDRSGMGR
jgi:hypothetical protein